ILLHRSHLLVFLDGADAGADRRLRAGRRVRGDRPPASLAAEARMSDAALQTIGLRKNFGALRVANGIDFRLEPGARHALIGPNGAGKTTFVNLVTGALACDEGKILLGGADVTGLTQERRVKRGLVRTFQITALFRGLAVLENVAMAVSERMGTAWHMLRPAGSRRAVM